MASYIGAAPKWARSISLPLIGGGAIQLDLRAGECVLVAGPNGTGKSALLSTIYRALGQGSNTEYLPGHRQITFNNENIEFTQMLPEQLAMNNYGNPDAHGRYRSLWAEEHLRNTLKMLSRAEIQFSQRALHAVQNNNAAEIALLQHKRSPVGDLNYVFESARLPIQLIFVGGSFRAQRGPVTYTIDKLSDGERAALFIASSVISRPENSIILIDEPEKHLNPSISGPLLSAMMRARPDLAYVMSTHDLQFIEWLTPERILHVRDSVVQSSVPETRAFDIHAMSAEDGISEALRASILGSRKAVLYIEGVDASFDKTIYSLVYPGWNIVPSGGWEQAVQYTRTLRENGDFHWLLAHALIDGDGRSTEEKSALESEGIHCLPYTSVENIVLQKSVVTIMANIAHKFVGGKTGPNRIKEIETAIPPLLCKNKDRIIGRRTVWSVNRIISESKVSVNDIVGGQDTIDSIDIKPILSKEETRFNESSTLDPFDFLLSSPIKDSEVPAKISNLLGFANFGQFKQAVVKQIQDGTPEGQQMLTAIRAVLPSLPSL